MFHALSSGARVPQGGELAGSPASAYLESRTHQAEDRMTTALTDWTGPEGLPRFDLIGDAAILPAINAALTEAAAAWEAIAADPAPANFDNTLLPMETAEDGLDRATAVFGILADAMSTPEREVIERDLAPRLAAHGARIMTDPRLLARVEAVAADAAGLTPEQARLVEVTLRAFRRGGAGLDDAGRSRMAEIGQRLATLTTQFSQNLLRDEREFALPIPESGLGGLPDSLIAAMRAAGAARGIDGPVLTVSRSILVPFLENATDRSLREAAQKAWAARGSGAGAGRAETDNLPLVAEILALRHEKARLLGYPDFAAYRLEPEMAGDAGRVEELLRAVWGPAAERAAQDAEALTELARADGINDPLEAWDWRFYAARRTAAQHALDPEAVKSYLTLDAMIAAAFDVANRLFGLEFTPFKAPLWHPDARAWRVTRNGRLMAIFLGDWFMRPGKRSGAWCGSLQRQHKLGQGQRAIVTNFCNFTPPSAPGEPATLSWDDARTVFHEFGHALHHILSDVTHPSLSGTAVARDFVELPSQLYEHWMAVPEVLDRHARHARTGEPLPADMRDRLIAADTADAGFATLEYLQSALVDLAFHRGAPPADPMAAQARVLADLGAPAAIPMRHATPQFQHAFAGEGYASGYYSYLWSEVMDADAFAAFTETGDPFDPATARRLEQAVLARGGSAAPERLWCEFRERMPGVGPLLAGRGLASRIHPKEDTDA